MPRKGDLYEALMATVETATDWLLRKPTFSSKEYLKQLEDQAFGVYFGAWRVSLALGCEMPDPCEWLEWVKAARDDLAARRAEVPHAAA